MQRVGFEPGTSSTPDWHLRKHDHGRFILCNAIFDEIIQLLLRSKVAKAESCLIGGYHDERIELTYYIETLINSFQSCHTVVELATTGLLDGHICS